MPVGFQLHRNMMKHHDTSKSMWYHTRWCPPAISWSKTSLKYSYIYHEPKLLELWSNWANKLGHHLVPPTLIIENRKTSALQKTLAFISQSDMVLLHSPFDPYHPPRRKPRLFSVAVRRKRPAKGIAMGGLMGNNQTFSVNFQEIDAIAELIPRLIGKKNSKATTDRNDVPMREKTCETIYVGGSAH